jgi:amidase
MTPDPHSISVEIAYASASEILRRLDDGNVTSRKLVEIFQSRIAAVDGPDSVVALRSIAAVNAEVLREADECDAERARGESRGPLHGVPILIKDNIEAVGLPGRAGSTSLTGRPPRDAGVVTKLRAVGAIVLGSTNLSEWANMRSPHSTSGWSATGGLVGNPWALDRSAGGSSSGSGAALAAGFAPLVIGTETDGSIVCPASLNGVVGLKPTVGRWPTDGVVPISASQDSPGPMARSVADLALFYGAMVNETAPAARTLRFGVATNWRTEHAATDAAFDEMISRLRAAGYEVVDKEVAVPTSEVGEDEVTVLLCEMADGLNAYLSSRPGDGVHSLADVIAFEAAHADTELAHFGHEYLVQAAALGGTDHERYAPARARNLHWAIEVCLNPALEGVDVLLAPSYAPAWKSDLTVSGHGSALASPVTSPSAIAGWPIGCVPMALIDGLPVGAAVVGRAHDEWTVIAAAAVLESVTMLECRPTFAPARRG